jgi:hypothetical protein
MPVGDAIEVRLRDLEARLRGLEDVEEIRRLKARYGDLVDARYGPDGPLGEAELRRRADEIAALFTDDAVWDGGGGLGLCRGRAEIAARMAAPTLRFSWHYFVKPSIEVAGDTARGRWDLLAPCTLRDGRPAWMAGVEDDEYRRVDDRWLHSAMRLRVVFFAPHETGWTRR